MSSMRNMRILANVLQYTLMTAGAVIFMFPLLWMVARSFMGLSDLLEVPPRIFPSVWKLNAYWEIWSIKPILLYVKNTLVIVAFTVFGTTFSAALCAYGFARLRFPYRNAIFAVVLSTMMLPGAVTMIPIYILFSKLHWVNTYYPLIVPPFFGGGAFFIFLLRQFFSTIPRDFDEAARMDGASLWGIFWRIALPLCSSALAVIAVFAFNGAWNDFMNPLIYLNSEKKFTLALGLYGLSPGGMGAQSYINTAQLMAVCSIAIIPVLFIFFIAQKRLISGAVLSSGVKG